jgi:hypothetical protein
MYYLKKLVSLTFQAWLDPVAQMKQSHSSHFCSFFLFLGFDLSLLSLFFKKF